MFCNFVGYHVPLNDEEYAKDSRRSIAPSAFTVGFDAMMEIFPHTVITLMSVERGRFWRPYGPATPLHGG